MKDTDEDLTRLQEQIRDSINRVRHSIQSTKDLLAGCGRRRQRNLEPSHASGTAQPGDWRREDSAK